MKLAEIADRIGGHVIGDAEVVIHGATGVEIAGPTEITFAVPPHLEKAAASKAGAVLVPLEVQEFTKPAIRVENPRVAFVELLALFQPPSTVRREIHPTAVLGAEVELGQNVAIMPYAVIEDGAVIGDNTILYPHTYVGRGARLGSDCILYPSATVMDACQVGNRVILHSGAVIGSDGFGYVTHGGEHRKVPQLGIVVLEDDVEVGVNSAIDRATTTQTRVGKGTKIDNLVHLAHNVEVGQHCFFVAQTGIAGSTKIGSHCTFAGQTGCSGHLNIGDGSIFTARSAPIGDMPGGAVYGGFPARPHKEWLRQEAAAAKLPDLVKKIRELEKRLARLEG